MGVIWWDISKSFVRGVLKTLLPQLGASGREFARFNPPHAIQDVGKLIDRTPLTLNYWLKPTAADAAIREIPATKHTG